MNKKGDPDTDALVLFSGGLDSTVSLYYELNRCARQGIGKVSALFINYGQRHGVRENLAAKRVHAAARNSKRYADHCGTLYNIYVPSMVAENSGLIAGGKPPARYASFDDAKAAALHDAVFVPHRNALLLTYAAIYAYNIGVNRIVTGLRSALGFGFPDCSLDFEQSLRQTLVMGTPQHELQFSSPMWDTKMRSVQLAKTIPECVDVLTQSYSCFTGAVEPCGECLACRNRQEQFRLAGLECK